MQQRFFNILEDVSSKFQELLEKENRFLIFSSYSPDSLSSLTLLIDYLRNFECETHVVFLQDLNKEKVNSLFGKDGYDENVWIFLDTGSIFINDLRKNAKNSNKKIFIFDHHGIISKDINLDNVYQINPNILGINGSLDISTSTIVYLTLRNIGYDGLSFLSLVGPISEFQDNKEFVGINKTVLDDLISNEIVELEKGLKLYSIKRPLYRALSMSFEIYLPNVTGSDEKSLEFLKSINISKHATISYSELEEEEKKKLISEVIKIRVKYDLSYDNIVGDIVKIKDQNNIKDIREISYIFYSSALGKKSNVIGYFLGNKNLFDELNNNLVALRNQIANSIYNIINEKWKIEKGDITIIEIPGGSIKKESLLFLSNVLSYNKLLKTRVILLLQKIENKYVGSLRINGYIVKKELYNVLYSLYEKNLISINFLDPIGGFTVDEDKLNEVIKNLKISLRQEGIII